MRILLIGDGPAAGCGVLTHELGVAGFLARHVAQHTRRGVNVAVLAQPAASARSTLKSLESARLEGYDAIVLMLATTDAFCLTSPRNWQRDMTGLLRALKGATGAPTFVTSAASLHLAGSLSPFARRITGTHAWMLNAETTQLCADTRTPMIPLDAAAELNSDTYAMWGRRIAEHVVCTLLDQPPTDRQGH